MSPEATQLLITSLLALGLVIIGKFYQFAQEWFLKVIFKQQTPRQKRLTNSYQLINQLLELRDKKRDNHDSYNTIASTIVERAVESTLNKYMDIARDQIDKIEDVCGRDDTQDALHQFDLISRSVKYIQIEVYMTSIKTNGYANKALTDWHLLLNTVFDSLSSKTRHYYKSHYTSKVLPMKAIMLSVEEQKTVFFNVFSEAMNQIKERAENLQKDNSAIDVELAKLINTIVDGK